MMSILKGKNILDRVRRKIKDAAYGSYDEINEAQSWIAKQTAFNFLRKSNIVGAGLLPEQKSYDLNISNVRSIQRIWISSASSTDVGDVTGITLSGSDPVSVGIVAHGLTDNRQVKFSDIVGTTELNSNTYRVVVTDADNFTLLGTDSSNFSAWVSGGSAILWDITDGVWDMMTESPGQLFGVEVKENSATSSNVSSSGTVVVSTSELDTNRSTVNWSYYLSGADSGAFMTLNVTPTPSTEYKIKIDYIKEVTEISEETIPDIPTSYVDALVLLASGYYLESSTQAEDSILGRRYIKRATAQFLPLVNDAHRNRAGSIDRPPAAWKY